MGGITTPLPHPSNQSHMPITKHSNTAKRSERGIYCPVTMVTSSYMAYKLCLLRVCFDLLSSANQHLHYSFQMCESEHQVWIQPVVISFPFHILKQLNLKTAKACVSLSSFFWIQSVASYFDRDLYTGPRFFFPPPL